MVIKGVRRTEDGETLSIRVVNEYNNLEVTMKWDGCINISKYYNGDTPENHSGNVDYMHICEVKDFIKELQDVVRIAEEMFGDNFEDYWS